MTPYIISVLLISTVVNGIGFYKYGYFGWLDKNPEYALAKVISSGVVIGTIIYYLTDLLYNLTL